MRCLSRKQIYIDLNMHILLSTLFSFILNYQRARWAASLSRAHLTPYIWTKNFSQVNFISITSIIFHAALDGFIGHVHAKRNESELYAKFSLDNRSFIILSVTISSLAGTSDFTRGPFSFGQRWSFIKNEYQLIKQTLGWMLEPLVKLFTIKKFPVLFIFRFEADDVIGPLPSTLTLEWAHRHRRWTHLFAARKEKYFIVLFHNLANVLDNYFVF